jgi:hypothetical protein
MERYAMTAVENTKPYGFFVDNKFFDNKVSALDYAKDINKVKLYFLDNEWSSVDWTVEPKESFQQLMDIRCQQIRQQFDHVSLNFSGGYDSTTILNGFIRNNLVIDELIFWRTEWYPYEVQEFSHAYEIGKNIKKNIWPKLKLTLYTKTIKNEIEYYKKYKTKWIENSFNFLELRKNVKNLAFEMNTELKGKHENPKHVLIEGRDKPRLNFVDNKWYTVMNDDLLQQCMHNEAEQFYFSPSFPKLHVKQVHMIIAWMEKTFECTHESVHQLQSHSLNAEYYEKWNLAIGRDPLVHTDSKIGAHKRFPSGGINSYINNMLKQKIQNSNPEIIKIWSDGINEIKNTFNVWDNSKNNLPTINSKQYYVRDYTTKN